MSDPAKIAAQCGARSKGLAACEIVPFSFGKSRIRPIALMERWDEAIFGSTLAAAARDGSAICLQSDENFR